MYATVLSFILTLTILTKVWCLKHENPTFNVIKKCLNY